MGEFGGSRSASGQRWTTLPHPRCGVASDGVEIVALRAAENCEFRAGTSVSKLELCRIMTDSLEHLIDDICSPDPARVAAALQAAAPQREYKKCGGA